MSDKFHGLFGDVRECVRGCVRRKILLVSQVVDFQLRYFSNITIVIPVFPVNPEFNIYGIYGIYGV